MGGGALCLVGRCTDSGIFCTGGSLGRSRWGSRLAPVACCRCPSKDARACARLATEAAGGDGYAGVADRERLADARPGEYVIPTTLTQSVGASARASRRATSSYIDSKRDEPGPAAYMLPDFQTNMKGGRMGTGQRPKSDVDWAIYRRSRPGRTVRHSSYHDAVRWALRREHLKTRWSG